MNAANLYLETIARSDGTLRRALEDLTVDELRSQPAGPGSNPIGWLVWHLTRTRDSIVSNFSGRPMVWESDGWSERFGMPGDVPRFLPENVHTFDPRDRETLVGYFSAVADRTAEIVRGLTDEDLERSAPPLRPGRPPMTVGARLVIVLNDNIQHIGQIAYVRGLVREQGWF